MSHSWFTLEYHRLNGGKASDWLRQSRQQETQTRPNHSPHLANETCAEPYGSIKHSGEGI